GFGFLYCGWHNHSTVTGRDIKYAFVGDPDSYPSACEAQLGVSPNNNPGADAMASIIAHELVESITDPNLNAWYDGLGLQGENADKCAWSFGGQNGTFTGTYTVANGAWANMRLGPRDYLIQQNWDANVQHCSLGIGLVDFSDTGGWNQSITYYDSIRL